MAPCRGSASSIFWPRSASWLTCSAAGPRPPACPRNRLILCLITDRRRLVARLGEPLEAWEPLLLAQLRGAVAGGVDVVQLREPDLPARALARVVRDCRALAEGTRCRIVVNDRLDVAVAAGADGVHLRESSVSVADVEQVLRASRSHRVPKVPGPSDAQVLRDFLIGRSVHDAATAAAARTADYLVAGSVFETASKPGRAASLGLDGLRAVVDAAGKCPVWAIGGVTPERMRELVACGVQGVAAIGAFLPPDRTSNVDVAVQKVTEALRFSLDWRG